MHESQHVRSNAGWLGDSIIFSAVALSEQRRLLYEKICFAVTLKVRGSRAHRRGTGCGMKCVGPLVESPHDTISNLVFRSDISPEE